MTFDVRLLGGFHFSHEGKPVDGLSTPRLRSLLAFLAVRADRSVSRRQAAAALWPDAREDQALNSLRNLLYRLRRALPAPDCLIKIDEASLGISVDDADAFDVVRFERLVQAGLKAADAQEPARGAGALEEAVRLYRGGLLPGLYDDWIFPERERLHALNLRALETLAESFEDARDYVRALTYARRSVDHDPVNESAYRRLMRLYALSDDRASALRVYGDCEQVLRRELNARPGATTIALYRSLFDEGIKTVRVTRSDEPPLVGRRAEWARVRAIWQKASGGRAMLLSISGESGIGKTRLASELATWANRQGASIAFARCYAAVGGLAYAPVVEWLRSDDLRPHVESLESARLGELSRLIPELSDVRQDVPVPGPLQEPWQRRRLLEAVVDALLSSERPTLLLVDDLQWADADTIDVLQFLVRSRERAPILVVATVRSEELTPGDPSEHLFLDLARNDQYEDVPLGPLDVDETAELVRRLGGRGPDALLEEGIFRETEGNPLFVVEYARASVPGDGTGGGIPSSVQAVIARRLSLVSTRARAVIETAATVGRGFTSDVVQRACGLGDEEMADALDELWRAHIIRETSGDSYDFAHEKMREVALALLSPARRRLFHQKVARALHRSLRRDSDAVLLQLATHLDAGGLVSDAVDAYVRVAETEQRSGSYSAAARHLKRAISLMDEMPAGPERDRRLLDVLATLGLALRIEDGHAAPSVGEAFSRALPLAMQIGDDEVRFSVHRGLWSHHLLRGGFAEAHTHVDALAGLARRLGAGHHLEALVALGLTACWAGEFAASRLHLDQALALYDRNTHADHALRYGQDPGVAGLSLLGLVRTMLGDAEEGRAAIQAGLDLAHRIDHPFSISYALQHSMLICIVSDDSDGAYRESSALLDLSREKGFVYWIGPALIGQGWALAVRGQSDAGIASLTEGLAEHGSRGAKLSETLWIGLLAHALRCAGRIDEAREQLQRASDLTTGGERFWLARLNRMKHELHN